MSLVTSAESDHLTDAELRRLATDLGDAGPDPVFGAGLVGLGDLCDAPT